MGEPEAVGIFGLCGTTFLGAVLGSSNSQAAENRIKRWSNKGHA